MSAVPQPGVNKGSSSVVSPMSAPSIKYHDTESNVNQKEEVSARLVSGSG